MCLAMCKMCFAGTVFANPGNPMKNACTMHRSRTSLFLILLFLSAAAFPQELTQTLRGRVRDAYTNMPLPGANVIVPGSVPLKGTVTNIDGYFRLEDLPVGRVDIEISMLGYQSQRLNHLLLTSGKELVIEVSLEEKVYELTSVEIVPEVRKDQAVNEMAMVSARSFSIEETERYAGSLGDPSRMAANFAGVTSVSDQRNDIIIRGNSPLGLLWRLEGVDIPNPNHFGSLGSTGGPISMLNNNLLANSDFYTGAFPASYGNALAGAFDLRMRNGNNQKREFMGQVGFNGFEAGAEGPFSPSSQASYLISFRYSTLEALRALGMSFGTGAAIPKYKDLSFKLNFPLKKGNLSLFGLGGNNQISMLDSQEDDAQYGFAGTDLYYKNKMGVLGLRHQHYLSEDTRIVTALSVSGIDGETEIYDLSFSLDTADITERLWEGKYTLSTSIYHRFNRRNLLNAGLVYDYYEVHYVGEAWNGKLGRGLFYLNNTGTMGFGRAFLQWKHRFSDALSLNAGLHAARLFLNASQSLEPRLAVKWDFRPAQSLNFGFGMHSQSQMRAAYFSQRLTDTVAGHYETTNRHLDFTRALHLVTGYERLLGEGHRLKAEAYFQYLYDVPVAWRRPEFSLISQGGAYSFMTYDNMENSGIGRNVGIELTLEKFLQKGFYYLLTTSLFDARYRGYDGEWRHSAFSNNFVFNVLGGYEWKTGKRGMLAFDLKGVYAGGSRYLPVDEEASREDEATRYDWDQAYASRFPDYFRLNARLTYRLNSQSLNQEWAVDMQNLTNHQNVFTQSWDKHKEEVSTAYQMGFMPMLTYRIHF